MNCFFDHFINEDLYPDLDREGAVQRLSKAIQCVTLNRDLERDSDDQFERLQDVMREGFPNVMSRGKFELVGRSVLITIEGSDPSLRPCLYTSHQDVVPLVRGTEDDWKYPAFSGEIAEGAIWGRGTLDIKNMVFGILEAAEYLLSKGARFKRTAYLAFGDDEETVGSGAQDISDTLKSRGVQLEFVMDEGSGSITDAAMFGAPGTYMTSVDLMEKGYADVGVYVENEGGHSSRPFGGSSLEHIARGITQITDHPFPIMLPDPIKAALGALKPFITEEPLRTLVTDIDGNAGEIAKLMSQNAETFPFITTTIAPTMIEGGSGAANVLPQNMSAVINFRLNQGTTVDALLEHCRDAVTDSEVEIRLVQGNDPSAVSRSDGYGFEKLSETAAEFFTDVVVIPFMTAGATDARRYEQICDTCMRFSPFMAEDEDLSTGVHGTNEHITVRSYIHGIRMLIRMMERCNLD